MSSVSISFPFKEEISPIFGKIRRPVAQVSFKRKKDNTWRSIAMLIDTGADYTLLPHFLSAPLDINLNRDCKVIYTQGVGGKSKVLLLKDRIEVKIGELHRKIPLGFLESDYIPPLLGRHEFLETFKVVFEKFNTTFE